MLKKERALLVSLQSLILDSQVDYISKLKRLRSEIAFAHKEIELLLISKSHSFHLLNECTERFRASMQMIGRYTQYLTKLQETDNLSKMAQKEKPVVRKYTGDSIDINTVGTKTQKENEKKNWSIASQSIIEFFHHEFVYYLCEFNLLRALFYEHR